MPAVQKWTLVHTLLFFYSTSSCFLYIFLHHLPLPSPSLFSYRGEERDIHIELIFSMGGGGCPIHHTRNGPRRGCDSFYRCSSRFFPSLVSFLLECLSLQSAHLEGWSKEVIEDFWSTWSNIRRTRHITKDSGRWMCCPMTLIRSRLILARKKNGRKYELLILDQGIHISSMVKGTKESSRSLAIIFIFLAEKR